MYSSKVLRVLEITVKCWHGRLLVIKLMLLPCNASLLKIENRFLCLYFVDLDVCEYVLVRVFGGKGESQMKKECWANGLWGNLPDIKGPGTALW